VAFCDRNSARLKGGLGVEMPMGLSFPDNRAGAEGEGRSVGPCPGPPGPSRPPCSEG
jgi:hypothetical protein